MFDFNSLCEFSRAHCIAICAFLVPANLLATLQTMILTGLGRPQVQVVRATVIAAICAIAMLFHVGTWWMIGVVMAPTYILFTLASVCLGINFWAVAHPTSMMRLLRALWTFASSFYYSRSLKFVRRN